MASAQTLIPARQSPKREKSAYERLARRHRRFVDHVVIGGTQTEAIQLAGCKSVHARTLASRWMKRPEILAAIDEREANLVHDVGLRQHHVLQQLQAVAMLDPRKLVDEKGQAIPLHQLDAQTAAAIASVEVEQISSDGETGVRYKYRFWDKVKANDRLGQWLKLWDARQTNVNVDARSVHIGRDGAGEGVLRAVDTLLERATRVRIAASDAGPDPHGSVLPASVCDGSAGSRSPLDARADSGSSGEP